MSKSKQKVLADCIKVARRVEKFLGENGVRKKVVVSKLKDGGSVWVKGENDRIYRKSVNVHGYVLIPYRTVSRRIVYDNSIGECVTPHANKTNARKVLNKNFNLEALERKVLTFYT